MSQRELDRTILKLALPALGTLLAEPLYVLTDTAIVGHLGTDQLAGLALATTILLTGYSVFFFLAYGTTASVSRLLGAGQERAAANQAVQGLWLALGLGVGLSFAGLFFGDGLIHALGGKGTVFSNASVYLRFSLAGLPALLLTLAGVGYLRGLLDTRTPLYVALGTSLFNLVLEWVFIFGLGFGIGASALATVFAQWVGAMVLVARVVRAAHQRGAVLKPDLQAVSRLLYVGVHLFIRTAALRGSLIVGTALATRIGREDLAGYQIGFEVWSFLALGLDALAIAAQALVARHLGAGDPLAARAVGRRVNELGVALGVALGALVVLFRIPLAESFTNDPAVVHLAAWSLLFVGLSQPINGWVFALDGTLISAGDQRFLAWAMVGAFAVFLPAALAVGLSGASVGWLWAALILLMTARLVLLQWRFVGDKWLRVGTAVHRN